MAYKVGSLGDLISGTHDATESKTSVIFEPKEYTHSIKSNEKKGISEPVRDASQLAEEALTSLRYETVLKREAELRPKTKSAIQWNTEEEELRTVFVKNLPQTLSAKAIKSNFVKYGDIDTVRLRCAVREDLKDRRRVAVIKKKFHPQRTNICAFIRYKHISGAEAALKANGIELKGYRIFVHKAIESKRDQKKAIFVGNLPFDAEENELYEVFKDCGKIEDIRIIRDRETGMGKGFAYVNFQSKDGVELALRLENVSVKNKVLRITRSKFNKKFEITRNGVNQKNSNGSRVNDKAKKHKDQNNKNGNTGMVNDKAKKHKDQNNKNGNTGMVNDKTKKQKDRKAKRRKFQDNGDDMSFPRGGNVCASDSKSAFHPHPKESKVSGGKRQDEGKNVDFYKDYKELFHTHPKTDSKQKPKSILPFQGRVISDKKKKKKKTSKEVLRKRKIAAILTNQKKI